MATTPVPSTGSHLMDKPNAKSVAWDHFGLEKGRDGKPKDANTAICRACNKRVAAKNGNTSNLLAHLRTHHMIIFSDVSRAMKGKQPSKSCPSWPINNH